MTDFAVAAKWGFLAERGSVTAAAARAGNPRAEAKSSRLVSSIDIQELTHVEQQQGKLLQVVAVASEKLSGFLTFYRQKKGAKDTLMLEVSEAKLGQLLMLQVTASTGTGDTPIGIYHGQPLRDLLFRLEKVDDSKILFLQPNIDYRAPGK